MNVSCWYVRYVGSVVGDMGRLAGGGECAPGHHSPRDVEEEVESLREAVESGKCGGETAGKGEYIVVALRRDAKILKSGFI